MPKNSKRTRARRVRGALVAGVLAAFLTLPAAAFAVDVSCDPGELGDPYNVPLSSAEAELSPFVLDDSLLSPSGFDEVAAGDAFATDALASGTDAFSEGTASAFLDDSFAEFLGAETAYVDGVEAEAPSGSSVAVDTGPSALVACSSATAVPPLAAHARGFNSGQQVGWNSADLTKSFNEMAYTRSRMHRLGVNWWDVQPEHLKDAPPDQWNWGELDRVVAAGRSRRFTLILTPTGSPNWARYENRRIPDEPSRKFRKFGYPDAPWHSYWDRFIQALADRYRNDVYAFEIWNEQNSRPFWDPSGVTDPDPALYANLFCRAAGAARTAIPGALVGIGGVTARRGMWEDGLGIREWDASDYLAKAFNAGIGGCTPSFVGFHPYVFKSFCLPAGDDPLMRNTQGMRELAEVNTKVTGPRGLKIWATEWSFPSRNFLNGRSTCRYTESRQASLIAREHNYLRTLSYVRYSIYFNIRDAPESAFRDFNNSVGLLRTTRCGTNRWCRKPSFFTWRSLAQS